MKWLCGGDTGVGCGFTGRRMSRRTLGEIGVRGETMDPAEPEHPGPPQDDGPGPPPGGTPGPSQGEAPGPLQHGDASSPLHQTPPEEPSAKQPTGTIPLATNADAPPAGGKRSRKKKVLAWTA